MKATDQYFPVLLFIMLYKVVPFLFIYLFFFFCCNGVAVVVVVVV